MQCEVGAVTHLVCVNDTCTIEVVLQHQSQLLGTLGGCTQISKVEVAEAHPVAFIACTGILHTEHQRVALGNLHCHEVGIAACLECISTAHGTLRYPCLRAIIVHYRVVGVGTGEHTVFAIHSIVLADGILYLTHSIVNVVAQDYMTGVECAIGVCTGTESGIRAQNIHTGLETLHGLSHGEVAVPSLASGHHTLYGAHERISSGV